MPEPQARPLDLTGKIIAYEQGALGWEDEVNLFVSLANSGTLAHLQGHYGRRFVDLRAAGYIQRHPEKAEYYADFSAGH